MYYLFSSPGVLVLSCGKYLQ